MLAEKCLPILKDLLISSPSWKIKRCQKETSLRRLKRHVFVVVLALPAALPGKWRIVFARKRKKVPRIQSGKFNLVPLRTSPCPRRFFRGGCDNHPTYWLFGRGCQLQSSLVKACSGRDSLLSHHVRRSPRWQRKPSRPLHRATSSALHCPVFLRSFLFVYVISQRTSGCLSVLCPPCFGGSSKF